MLKCNSRVQLFGPECDSIAWRALTFLRIKNSLTLRSVAASTKEGRNVIMNHKTRPAQCFQQSEMGASTLNRMLLLIEIYSPPCKICRFSNLFRSTLKINIRLFAGNFYRRL